MRSRYKLVTNDKDGVTVRFTYRAYNKHKNKHIDLLDPTFLPPRVVNALKNPNVIMPDYVDRNARCYYYQEFGGSACRFTKVVVDISRGDIYYIKTAFRPDNIKEYKYKLKAIYDDGSTTS